MFATGHLQLFVAFAITAASAPTSVKLPPDAHSWDQCKSYANLQVKIASCLTVIGSMKLTPAERVSAARELGSAYFEEGDYWSAAETYENTPGWSSDDPLLRSAWDLADTAAGDPDVADKSPSN